ncbi:MAG: type IV pilus assembly protein PilM [bacterium]
MGFFSIFSQSDNSILGVDIGSTGIKAVALTIKDKQAALKNYGTAELSVDWLRSDKPEAMAEAVMYLKALVKRLGLSTRSVYAGIPTFTVYSSVVSLPVLPPKEMSLAVEAESRKFIPMPVADVSLDYKLLPQEDAGMSSQRVLVTAAPKKIVSRYSELFRGAGLSMASLETEAFALGRALLGKDPTPAMVIDLGSTTTDIIVFDRGVPVVTRSLDVGGTTISIQLARTTGVSLEEAEQLKRDVGIPLSSANQQSPLENLLQPIMQEIKYSHDLYEKQKLDGSIEKIILTGGTAQLPHLAERIESMINVRTYVGDPWARIITPQVLKPALDELGSRLAVAIGLALRGIE